MWSAITKIFTKNSSNNNEEQSGEYIIPTSVEGGDRLTPEDMDDSKLAKQRASLKWLLSKAFNNKVPDNLKEPFYRDHENQEHLKPQIVGALANAEIYCMALGNIYSDPNYHNLNHWSILQTLARKGVYVTEPSDAQLTETTLIQTNPIRMSAHMAVIESIMVLYAREVLTPDRVLAAVQRFTFGKNPPPPLPHSPEEGIFLWVTHACQALRKRIQQDFDSGVEGERLKPPTELPQVKDFKDLGDGVALAALISYYCPDELPWTEIKISHMPTVQDSLYNLNLLQDFCNRCLPSSIFSIQPEDITYMRDSMKSNLMVFLADLFNVIEINPAKCVRCPGMDKAIVSKATPTHVPLRKTHSLQQSVSEMSEDSLRRCSEDSFVVHRGKNIPTLKSVAQQNNKITNNDWRNNEDIGAAGRPSNWEENRKSTFAGRRSRRNSMSDDSQLTIENFGGSQDNINFIGRNTDKEVGRKISAPAFPVAVENPAVRSSKQDARGSFQLGYDNGCENDDLDKLKLKRQLSSDDISLRRLINNKENNETGETINRMSFAQLNKEKSINNDAGIHFVYQDKERLNNNNNNNSNNNNKTNGEKKTTFAVLPNTTTWQQQSTTVNQQQQQHDNTTTTAATTTISNDNVNIVNPVQLNDIRLKLEEKRRIIESEKRRIELAMNKQRQKVGKAAFLQAIAKGRGNLLKTPPDAESNNSATMASESPPSESEPPTPQRPFTLQEINDDASAVERKWLDEGQPFIETRRTPELENMDLEQYQQSIAQMNSSLSEIQTDIQRLASQQNQIQAAQQQSLIVQQQKQIQVLQQQQQQQIYYQQQQQHQIYTPLQSSSSVPHIPQSLYQQQQFFLHEQPTPSPPQRRTWAQQPPLTSQDLYHQQPELRTWKQPQQGFVLHEDRYQKHYQNGNDESHALHHSNSFTLSQQHLQQQQQQQQQQQYQYGTTHSTPSASPQHRNIHRQISQLMDESKRTPVSLQQMEATPIRKTSIIHAPVAAPPVDDMEPQNISFIGNSDDQLTEGLSRLNITSGSRTYRIPSPTRPLITKSSFKPTVASPPPPPPQQQQQQQQQPSLEKDTSLPIAEISSLDKDPTSQKGFYIKFDDEPPKRPKPPLRTKKSSPKKERSYIDEFDSKEHERIEKRKQLERELEEERIKKEYEVKRRMEEEKERSRLLMKREASQDNTNSEKMAAASALIIGNDLNDPDPDLAEKKKERIMMLSLQRRQEQEEAKLRKEAEAQARREREKAKEEEKARKKEEQAARRAAILEQYKLKKAMEEAEREGKVFERPDLMNSLKPTPKMRPKAQSRPRPKTIHIDSGSVEMAEGMLQPSRGKKGSTSNLTGHSTMKRDYYRGSQDSLADRSMTTTGLLYRGFLCKFRGGDVFTDSPDDSRGMSPCHSANQTLGRRSSYKTSRDTSPAQPRGRSKYSTNYQNFKGRKSSSLMNLYGSSTDQDSLAYRYGDTDSGLGRATPPRRAPSPGMGSMRHLPSPSGPGSLPGLMSKGRRMFDDGSSDISSTPSSMMDYTGPRLYKQPATKSNRGIMLNAVEYCVFPGVVNREAKKRVLEEINRSESKHFLILFRDAGCQFRALYSYCPEREEVIKLYGTGPKTVNDRMFDKFFKYNSGGKCFSQVHTKHLTVTIDAFTIHNSLWQGKKVNLPNKKDMALVI